MKMEGMKVFELKCQVKFKFKLQTKEKISIQLELWFLVETLTVHLQYIIEKILAKTST